MPVPTVVLPIDLVWSPLISAAAAGFGTVFQISAASRAAVHPREHETRPAIAWSTHAQWQSLSKLEGVALAL